MTSNHHEESLNFHSLLFVSVHVNSTRLNVIRYNYLEGKKQRRKREEEEEEESLDFLVNEVR